KVTKKPIDQLNGKLRVRYWSPNGGGFIMRDNEKYLKDTILERTYELKNHNGHQTSFDPGGKALSYSITLHHADYASITQSDTFVNQRSFTVEMMRKK
ncbi:MAG: hypothetical protein RL757_1345, partial [Bacteroidota bacterium]